MSKASVRAHVRREIQRQRPYLVIGSPPCTDWSALMNFNWDKMDPEAVAERKRVARAHLEFCAKLHKIQHNAGRYFLHEHPNSATSWHEESIKELCGLEGVLTVVADQCEYGLTAVGPNARGPAQKPTRFMTNAPEIVRILYKRCKGDHRHITLMGC